MSQIIQQAEQKMKKSIESFQHEIAKLRTGRAHPSLLEHIKVDYYGTDTPIAQIANVTASDARTLTVQPWEKNLLNKLEKAILESDLGLNPSNNGDVIRIPIPALNEERRKELVKILRNEAEKSRVAIRNIRRDANQEIKNELKEKLVTEDDAKRAEDETQKQTNKYIAEVDSILNQKETDLMAL